jgi:hypothetical protein
MIGLRNNLLILLMLLGISIAAQEQHLGISIRSGVSVPLGEYAAQSLDHGCFTLPGLSVVTEARYPVFKSFHLMLQGGIQFHPVDVGALGYAKVLDDPFMMNVYIRSEAYRIIHAVGGLAYTYEFGSAFTASAKLLAGMIFSQTPYQVYRPAYFLMGPDYFVITSARDRSFTYGAGLDLSYKLNSCINLQLGSEALFSQAAFGFVSAGASRTDWRKIYYLNLTLGVQMFF